MLRRLPGRCSPPVRFITGPARAVRRHELRPTPPVGCLLGVAAPSCAAPFTPVACLLCRRRTTGASSTGATSSLTRRTASRTRTPASHRCGVRPGGGRASGVKQGGQRHGIGRARQQSLHVPKLSMEKQTVHGALHAVEWAQAYNTSGGLEYNNSAVSCAGLTLPGSPPMPAGGTHAEDQLPHAHHRHAAAGAPLRRATLRPQHGPLLAPAAEGLLRRCSWQAALAVLALRRSLAAFSQPP